ncbi:MAG: hypothetical protein QW376_08775 [Candidatus Caldarchaeum sp.]
MTEAQSKKRLLILGSGFSKAVSDKMPVVRELADALKKQIKEDPELKDLEDPKYQHLLNDPELLLTYLAQDQPWKEPWEAPKEWAVFLKISKWLAGYIQDCEAKAFKQNDDLIPTWKPLASWLHQTRTPVITFNYDTVLERICYHSDERLDCYCLYNIPLSTIFLREAGTFGGDWKDTFCLIKLHGSINWFYSGVEQFPGEQIYFRNVDKMSPDDDMVDEDEAAQDSGSSKKDIERLLSDKVALIIPPVAEKSRFYANQTIRSLWSKAREYLKAAEEIYVVGYSLPDTDLTTKLLLQTACTGQPKTVYIVNNDEEGKNNLLRRYHDAFPQETNFKDDYIRSNAVEAMVKDLCKEEALC